MTSLEIQRTFEEAFQIAFISARHSDTSFEIGPKMNNGFLFRLLVAFSTEVRFSIKFQPESFGLSVIKAMSAAPTSQRAVSASYFDMLLGQQCVVDIAFDGVSVDAKNPLSWPKDWKAFSLNVTKRFIALLPEKNHIEVALPYVLTTMAALLALLPMEDVDLPSQEDLVEARLPEAEGTKYQITLNRYERSGLNRSLCILTKGFKCAVCGMDFEEKYGTLGKGYIQVHHIVPVSQIGPDYQIDPEKDLVPVCPNCHAMLHRRNPPLSVEELKAIIKKENA